MGEIRKDNLHESLIEELNELANIDLSGKQDKTDESLLTESKDLVGAINELFQSANNGKELIASAIGEPVSAEDTFSAMSNDINDLLSTFKTNMMNNGITVESGDKFKQLIDKIATMVEEGSGKGIQYAEGTSDVSISSSRSSSTGTITTNLDFTPSIIFILSDVTFTNTKTMTHTNVLFSNNVSGKVMASNANAAINQYVSISDITYENFIVTLTSNNCSGSMTVKTWYAIGIGEEDTTLRDSLASILQEEGVSVTEEDDMANLISKVDEEFNDKENEISSLEAELAGKVTPVGTAITSNVLTGKTFINSTGNTLTGTMANNGTKTITPKASAQTLGAGYYDKITINGDADLVAANIVSGKNIFGVTGTASTLKSSSNFNYAFFTSYNTTIYINGGASDTQKGQNYLITSFTNNAGDCTLRISGLTVHVSQYYDLAYTVEFVRNGSVVYTSTTEEVGNTKFSKDYTGFKKGDVFNFYIKSISNSAKNSGVKDLMVLGSLSV